MHADLATALRSLVGQEYCYTDAAAAAYAIDGIPPAVVVCPEDDTQVAAVMRLAHEHHAEDGGVPVPVTGAVGDGCLDQRRPVCVAPAMGGEQPVAHLDRPP